MNVTAFLLKARGTGGGLIHPKLKQLPLISPAQYLLLTIHHHVCDISDQWGPRLTQYRAPGAAVATRCVLPNLTVQGNISFVSDGERGDGRRGSIYL